MDDRMNVNQGNICVHFKMIYPYFYVFKRNLLFCEFAMIINFTISFVLKWQCSAPVKQDIVQ